MVLLWRLLLPRNQGVTLRRCSGSILLLLRLRLLLLTLLLQLLILLLLLSLRHDVHREAAVNTRQNTLLTQSPRDNDSSSMPDDLSIKCYTICSPET